MRKTHFLLFLVLISAFMMSCGRYSFNPRYYYGKNSSYSSDEDGGINIPDVEAPKEIPAEEDPFKVDSEYNNPNYGGYNASKFDSWLFKASFRDDKLPIYTFFDDTARYWTAGGMDWNSIPANYYLGKDGENKAQGYAIKNLTVYKYDKDNPLYDDKGYLPGRMDRFRFYSINGVSGVASINAPLKQYLIAVDTYSKFVFAFGKITGTESFMGQDVPSKFEAIEYHADKKHFYEYDPIGYVTSTGEVAFYQHYIDEFVANPTSYTPKQHGYDNYAEHNKTKPGKSPYVPLNSNTEASDEDKKKYEKDIKQYAKEYKYRNYSGYQKSPTGEKGQIDLDAWKEAGYAGNSLILYTYKLEDNGNKLTITEEYFNSNEKKVKTYNMSLINTEYKATYTNISDTKDSLSVSIVKNDAGNNTISVSGTVLDENFQDYGPIFPDRVRSSYFKRDGERAIGGGIGGITSSTFPLSIGGKLKDLEYTFNEDGTEFTMKYTYDDGGLFNTKWVTVEYRFKLARFDSDVANTWTAKYQCLDLSGTLGNYSRVVLRDNGQLIRSSMTLHSINFPENPNSNSGLEMIADKR